LATPLVAQSYQSQAKPNFAKLAWLALIEMESIDPHYSSLENPTTFLAIHYTCSPSQYAFDC
jgi:hypothetical protein